MNRPISYRQSTARIRSGLPLVLTLMLLLTLLVPASTPSAAHANPSLMSLAMRRPEQLVTVIVQKALAEAPVEAQIARLGGVVTYDLHFMQALAAKLPARAAVELSRLPDVRWVVLDATVEKTSDLTTCPDCISTANLVNTYVQSIGATQLWNESPGLLQGQGVTVAVIDSGINSLLTDFNNSDGSSRVVKEMTFAWGNVVDDDGWDQWGHGTHVAGIIGGNGASSSGKLIGVAPKVNLLNIKVGDGKAEAGTADVIAALQWVYDHQAEYNIRVANISLTSTVAESYNTSPLNAAVELLWFKGITVVVAGGNNGLANNGIGYAPSNDPFVISVGAVDEQGTPSPSDDRLASFSARGVTGDGFAKPDLVAPGVNIVSLLSSKSSVLAKTYRDHLVSGLSRSTYFRLSGTSMSSAVAAGAAALVIQDEPNLTPDQVKARLITDARPFSDQGWSGAYLDVYAAVHGSTLTYANQGVPLSQLLWSDNQPVIWNSVNWSSVNWSSVNWSSVNWSSVNWSSVAVEP